MTHIDIDALARLARIALTDGEKQALAGDVATILSFGRALVEADRADESRQEEIPDAAACAAAGAALRADEPAQSLAREELLRMAPSSAGEYVTVPHVLSNAADGKEGDA